jgi:hypothetical protein
MLLCGVLVLRVVLGLHEVLVLRRLLLLNSQLP